MNRFLYTVILYLATPFILLYLCYRAFKSADYRGRIAERFGFKLLKPQKSTILVHSVSVGETIAATPLINRLISDYPTYQIVVTTSTPTGSAEVKSRFGDRVLHCYLPIDLPGAVKRFLNHLQPQLCIIMETELWPNLIHQLDQRDIPTLLANARMSQKSADGYRAKAAPLMRDMLSKLNQVSAQFASDGQRFVSLGLAHDKLKISGSIKFDLTIDQQLITRQKQLKQQWADNRLVWVAGSTHPVEHEKLMQTHRQLLTQFPDLLLIIVPRHPERFDEVAKQCQDLRFNYIRRSTGEVPSNTTQIVVGDTMGELMLMFGLADISYVGGSLIERGGHNPLEPAALGKPVLMGESTYNFSDICQHLTQAGGLKQVEDEAQLQHELTTLFNDVEQRRSMGSNARDVVNKNQGTVERLLAWVAQYA